ncbi:MAG TPA: hypothetical protein DHN29_15525 [Cytophagales bacterium]|nr:hypothetical protein [Cytophagales bacterium]
MPRKKKERNVQKITGKYELVPTSMLEEHPANPHKISRDDINRVKRSIKQFGFKKPILIDQNYIICAGTTAYRAGRELGLKHIPCWIDPCDSVVEFEAYMVADNRVGDFRQYEKEKEDRILNSVLGAPGIDIHNLGHSPLQLDRFLQRQRGDLGVALDVGTPEDDSGERWLTFVFKENETAQFEAVRKAFSIPDAAQLGDGKDLHAAIKRLKSLEKKTGGK